MTCVLFCLQIVYTTKRREIQSQSLSRYLFAAKTAESLVNKISREMRKGKKKQGNWGRQKMVKRGLGRRPTVGSYCKNPPKTRFNTDCTCACNGLTNFECEAQATGNGSYM